MKRSWKDAACEVCFKKAQQNNEEGFPYISVSHFLRGERRSGNYTETSSKWPSVIIDDFPAFRSAFMRWLDENEVKQ